MGLRYRSAPVWDNSVHSCCLPLSDNTCVLRAIRCDASVYHLALCEYGDAVGFHESLSFIRSRAPNQRPVEITRRNILPGLFDAIFEGPITDGTEQAHTCVLHILSVHPAVVTSVLSLPSNSTSAMCVIRKLSGSYSSVLHTLRHGY